MIAAVGRTLRRHWLLSLFVLGGLALRVVVTVAYHPALLYIDSFRYLTDVGDFAPDGLNPIGYELLLLGPLMLVGNLGFVVVVQHLLGLGLGVAIYALLRRFGVLRSIAALAAVPVLLDAYQVQIEHNIMSDLLFQILLLLVVALLLRRPQPGPRVAAIAGVVLALSVIVRIVAITLVLPAAVFVLLAAGFRPRDGWRRRLLAAVALAGGFVGILFGYSMYYMLWTGVPGLNNGDASPLYGRAAVVADCRKLDLTRAEQVVCPDEPRAVREANGIDYYLHLYRPPDALVTPEDYKAAQASLGQKVLFQQPLDMLGGVAQDFFKGFAPIRTQSVGDVPLDRWQFQTHYPMYTVDWYVYGWAEVYDVPLGVHPGAAGFLRAYQLGGGYAPGIVLGGAFLVGLAAVAGVGRARRSGLRAVCLLPSGVGLAVLWTAAGMEFSWRYQLPALVLAPLAAALGVTALTGWRDASTPRHRANVPGSAGNLSKVARTTKETEMPADFPDEVDRAALRDYEDRYGQRAFAPVVLLIAAYNEDEALGGVLDAMPSTCCGLDVDTLVVVDGATDDTTDVALRHGARTCVVPTNRGQGAALRLGYQLAAERGARYVVTTDADGQYDIAELPTLLRPLIDDEADFVTGSRRLGRSESTDALRRAGTYAFAWMVSAMTRQRITDTSFGFRAMSVEVPNSVTLEQQQYQSSELLVGVLARGYRVLEQPMTMLARTAGHSKKGNNLLYGYRYARVVIGTWLRERRAAVVGTTTRRGETVSEPAAVGER